MHNNNMCAPNKKYQKETRKLIHKLSKNCNSFQKKIGIRKREEGLFAGEKAL